MFFFLFKAYGRNTWLEWKYRHKANFKLNNYIWFCDTISKICQNLDNGDQTLWKNYKNKFKRLNIEVVILIPEYNFVVTRFDKNVFSNMLSIEC